MEYFGRANWAKFVTEYGTVKEGKDLYELDNEMRKQIGKNKSTKVATISEKEVKLDLANKELVPNETLKLADTETSVTSGIEENATTNITAIKEKYPIIENSKVETSNIESTLKETIKFVENITDEDITDDSKISLYKVDMNLIKLDIKNEYVINIRTGELYKLKGVKYKGKTYHRPDLGVTKSGEVEQPPKEIPEDTEETIYLYLQIPNYKEKQLTTKLTEGEVEWSTSDESVVTVEKDGERTAKVTGIAKGEATVTISYKTEDTGDDIITDDESGGMTEGEEEVVVEKTQKYKIIVEDGIPEEFTLELEDKTINEYEESRLEAKIEGVPVGTSYLKWESSDETKVKVDINGKVTGVAQGEAIITCKWKDDETITANCKVTVQPNQTLILDKTKMNIAINQKVQIIAKYKDENVTNVAQWRSEDKNIVTVDTQGKVQAIGIGTTNIIAEYQGKTAICKVTVKDYIEEIYTIEDLSLFANQVNEGNKFEGNTVKVMKDLNFKDEASYESTSSTEYANYYTNTKTWVRIGNSTSKYFAGTFNGNGKTITNLNINATVANQGLFGYSKGGIFKNIVLKDVRITSTSYQVGSVLGNGTSVTINNCRTSGNINTTGQTSNCSRTGGIVGLIGTSGGNISSCINEVTVGGSYNRIGGIVGQMYKGTIMNCTNIGNISTNNGYVGGISGSIGQQKNINYTVIIDNCRNHGEITGKYNIGGISGTVNQSSLIKDCTNYKTGITNSVGCDGYSDSNVAGIVGTVYNNGNSKIENCHNYAEVIGKYNGVGGIVGTSMKGTVTDCKNEGKIEGSLNATGGINGRTGYDHSTRKISTKSIVENCMNAGIVNSTGNQTGGISGNSSCGSEIRNCNNYVKITGTGNNNSYGGAVGGIVGNIAYNKDGIVENCNNYGDVQSSYSNYGGIVGYHHRGIVKNCTNEGAITGQRSFAGGIAGHTGRNNDAAKTKATVENCFNKGEVTITGTGVDSAFAGGITGRLTYGSSITKSGNVGNITVNGYSSSTYKESRVGGIVGFMADTGANIITYCYNTGNITGKYKGIGGISGAIQTTTSKINNCYSIGIVTGPANIGGIVGKKIAGTVTDCYYLEDSENGVRPTTGSATEGGIATDDVTEIKNLINLDIWKDYFKSDKIPNINKGFPILEWQ